MIFPKPQKYCLSGEAVMTDGIAFCVEGEESEYIQEFLSSKSISTNGKYLLTAEKVCDANSEYIEEAHRLSNEKYRLDITENAVKITYSAKNGLFYALNTLVKLIDSGKMKTGFIEDYPLFLRRGYIEGFYGKPWQDFDRFEVLKLMAAHGMNTYFYAPKDDPYHREKWREPYPAEQLKSLRRLVSLAEENCVDFFWCIAPGLNIKYSDTGETRAIVEKLKTLYGIGISHFGLLLDDIPEELQYEEDRLRFASAADAHIYLCNTVFRLLRNIDENIGLTVCPLQYHGCGNEYYISKFGQGLEPEIDIFWTGRDICSQRLSVEEAYTFIKSTRHRPLYWDNYPVNDTEMLNEMHLGPLIGRDPELFRYSEGLISNVMEYAICSEIPLLTIADYLWNPLAYDEDESYEYAQRTVLGSDSGKFSLISEHLRVSCLSRYASQNMSDFFAALRFEFFGGSREKALEMLNEYTSSLEECAAMLKADKPLFNELRQWSDKFCFCAEILRSCVVYLTEPTEKMRQEIKRNLEKYNRDGTVLTGFCFTEAVNDFIREN